MTKVRVRGIYATALSHLFLKNGYKIVQPSDVIANRLNISFDNSPPDVTVKDAEDDSILVIGKPYEARSVFHLLSKSLKFVFRKASRVELNSVYLGRVEKVLPGTCVVDVGEFKGVLRDCKGLFVNDKVIVGVSKPSWSEEEPVELTQEFKLLGDYVSLIHGSPRIDFSEHIRDKELKNRLSAIALSKLLGSGLGVKFRSSARFADPGDVGVEIEALLNEYKRLMEVAKSIENPGKVRTGEFIGLISLTSIAKKILDHERRSVTPTVPGHHELKGMGFGDELDLVEKLVGNGCDMNIVGNEFREWICSKISGMKRFRILHYSPVKGVRELTPGFLKHFKLVEGKACIVLERVFRSKGIYDGLGIEKLPGDKDLMIIKEGSYVVSHNYFRNGNWLGSYININTPPEIAPGIVKYYDLVIDVVVKPGENPVLIDLDQLSQLNTKGVVSEQLYFLAEKVADLVIKNPQAYVCENYREPDKCLI